MSDLIGGRFDTTSLPIKDILTDKQFAFMPADTDYIKVQYKPGFIHPYAYDEMTGNAIVEKHEFPKLNMQIMDENELRKKILPLLLALQTVLDIKKEPYGSLNPDSIYDTPNGFFLGDFGTGATPNLQKRTSYSAYEYFAFQGKGNAASDVYSVCAIIYQLLTGIPLDGPDDREAKQEILEPLLAFGISPELSDAVEKGLSLYADDRYPTIKDFTNAVFSEKELTNYKNDWDISMRSLKHEAEQLKDMEKKKTYKEEEEESPSYEDVEEERPKNNNKKMLLLLGAIVVVFVGAYAATSLLQKEPVQEAPKEIVQDVVPVSGTGIDYSEDPTPAPVTFAAVSPAAVSPVAVEPTFTPEPTITPAPTEEPEATIEPTVQPTEKPKATKKPKETPKPTKKPKKKKKPVTTLPPAATKKPVSKTTPKHKSSSGSKSKKPSANIRLDPDKISIE